MFNVLDFDNIAVSCVGKLKRRFPRLDFDDLLQEARLIMLKAKVDESKDAGEIAQYLKTLVEWRLKDILRREQGLRYKERNKLTFVSYEAVKDDNAFSNLDELDFKRFCSKCRRREFLEEIKRRVDLVLLKSREMQILYRYVFIEGLTEKEIARKTGVSLRVVCQKRQQLLDTIHLSLKDIKV